MNCEFAMRHRDRWLCRRNLTELAFLRWTNLRLGVLRYGGVTQVALAYCCAFLRFCVIVADLIDFLALFGVYPGIIWSSTKPLLFSACSYSHWSSPHWRRAVDVDQLGSILHVEARRPQLQLSAGSSGQPFNIFQDACLTRLSLFSHKMGYLGCFTCRHVALQDVRHAEFGNHLWTSCLCPWISTKQPLQVQQNRPTESPTGPKSASKSLIPHLECHIEKVK